MSSRTRARSRSRERSRSRDRHRDRSRDRQRSRSRSRERRRAKDGERGRQGRSSGGSGSDVDEEAARKARKAEKKRLKREKEEYEQKLNEVLGYSSTANPYGDVSLHEKFQWHKKREVEEKVLGLTPEQARRRDMQRRQEAMLELEKIKKRRVDREAEQALHEQETLRMQRDREREAYGDLEQKENEFHLNQAKVRAQIRIREGRAKPIDILAMSMNLDYNDVEITLDEPYMIFQNLSVAEVEELKNDILMYLELAKDSSVEFWQNMLVVCQDELDKLRATRNPNARSGQAGIHDVVNPDVVEMLRKKTTSELKALQRSVTEKLSSGEPVDVEYWESLLKSIVVHTCIARLREMHQKILQSRLHQLRAKQREEALQAQDMLAQSLVSEFPNPDELAVNAEEMDLGAAGKGSHSLARDQPRPPSPSLLPRPQDPSLEVVDEITDLANLMSKRAVVTGNKYVSLTAKMPGSESMQKAFADTMDEVDQEEKLFLVEKARDMDMDEQAFNAEIEWTPQVYKWQDKYRPRKPRYFNRVHTGYEWNKYNQTHYDHDNPPPKVVQGYKFSIFYPDLINKAEAPTYKLLPDPESKDGSTVILLFHAGPPYEDIAFRIVNREWEQSHKKGFRSSFDKGVLYLHFHFLRYRYRK